MPMKNVNVRRPDTRTENSEPRSTITMMINPNSPCCNFGLGNPRATLLGVICGLRFNFVGRGEPNRTTGESNKRK